jgi:tetratricopeptide (TPR) repeat protein
MTWFRNSGTDRYRPGRSALLLGGVILLSACASLQPVNPEPPRLQYPGPEIQIPEVDVLAVTPAMDVFLERYILPYTNSRTQTHLLYQTVLKTGVLGFKYDESRTLTAAEAFATRSGNCIGFANMMIALARRAGLKASYQEIAELRQWEMNDETMLLVKHVNVVVEGRRENYVLDVSGINIGPAALRRIVSDDYAKALYLNNLGAMALIENDLPTAYAYLKYAISVEPRVIDSWVNLGVVFAHNDQLDEAIDAYQRALQIEPSNLSAMNNLYEIYLEKGDARAAQDIQTRVEKHRRNNPYYLMYLSQEALAVGQYEESISLAQRAIEQKEDDHLLYFALAMAQYQGGKKMAAENSMNRARELAPPDRLATYTRPLDELIAEEMEAREAMQPD